MDVQELLSGTRDAITVKRVFGEPYEKDGVTVIPAAHVAGAGGGGGGQQEDGSTGSGSGFGLGGRPAGAYVIKDGVVRWQPALDLNRFFLGWQAVAIVALLTIRALANRRR